MRGRAVEDNLSLPFTGATTRTRATSRGAAESKETDASTERLKVLAFLRTSGTHGATDDEIQLALGMAGDTERPRRIELARMGCITHFDVTRVTRKGRQAVVWNYVKEQFDGPQ